MALTQQARTAQAACLRAKGWDDDARLVESGQVDFDPTALEMLDHAEDAP
jgi:hypothetical protein